MMWSTLMAPQGHGFLPAKQHQRDFGILFPLPIAPGKTFKNPNFVNNLYKYQSSINFDSCSTKNYRNSSQHSHIIDSIKEQCPEVIPSIEEESTPSPPVMCFNRTQPENKGVKRERAHKKKNQLGKKSRQNQNRQIIIEMMQEDQDLSNQSLDTNFTETPHTFNLIDFISAKSPKKVVLSPPTKVVSTIEIPIVKNTDMVLTITKSPPCRGRARQYSVTDSEDSFVVFNPDGNEENLDNCPDDSRIHEASCTRRRVPSFCESEDSFIIFEGSKNDNLDHDSDSEMDYSFESGEEESEEELDSSVDSSFSILEPKRVRFAVDEKLCEVHPMIQWSYAYQAARKGPWEEYARDRCRFRDKISGIERQIKHVFDPNHRENIYRERFEKEE